MHAARLHALLHIMFDLGYVVLVIVLFVEEAAARGVIHAPPKRLHTVLLVRLVLLTASRDATCALVATSWSKAAIDVRVVRPPRLFINRA